MPTFKLVYFDMDGGRGEPVRIAFHAAGIEFEDERWPFPDFLKRKTEPRFNCLPTLFVDGVEVTQSNAMCRYVGKMAGLYPEDDLQALYCDEAMEAVEDLLHHIVRTFGLEGDALKKARDKLRDGWLTVFLTGLAELLERGGGRYFADNRLTMADLKVFVQVRSLRRGTLDHIPADFVDTLAPALAEHCDRIAEESIVKAWYSHRDTS